MVEDDRVVSEAEAWQISTRFAEEVAALLTLDMVAVVVVGSLASDSYAPGRSDIDLIVVARNDCPDKGLGAISAVAERYWRESGIRKGFGGYGIRQRDLEPPYGVLHDEAFEILQLRRGRVIRGELDLDEIPEPTQEDMRRSLVVFVPDIFRAWSRSYPPPIDTKDARVNTILYWLRFLVWDRTGNYLLDKRGALAAAQSLAESAIILSRLEPVAAYVTQRQDRPPDDITAICREIEEFVLDRVPWARKAAQQTKQPE